ncbi:MAG: peptidoglycan-associated lipoprotein Pal [Desulfosarcina sp.]
MMKRKWMLLLMLLVLPALLFSVSCAKRAVVAEPTMTEADAAEAARQAQLEQQKALEQERQRKLEEERLAAARAEQLKAEAAQRDQTTAKNRFVNEMVYFAFDDSSLDQQAQEVLREKAVWLRDNPDASVIIEGHTDERGTNAYNLALGERRAESVKSFLVNLGVDASRLTTISYGEERPIAFGQTEAAWAQNRRVAFVLE